MAKDRMLRFFDWNGVPLAYDRGTVKVYRVLPTGISPDPVSVDLPDLLWNYYRISEAEAYRMAKEEAIA